MNDHFCIPKTPEEKTRKKSINRVSEFRRAL